MDDETTSQVEALKENDQPTIENKCDSRIAPDDMLSNEELENHSAADIQQSKSYSPAPNVADNDNDEESYEMVDVIDNESDAEENNVSENEGLGNHSAAEIQQSKSNPPAPNVFDKDNDEEEYEMIDVIESESDAEEIHVPENENNMSGDSDSRNVLITENGCGQLPKIGMVYENVSEWLLGCMTKQQTAPSRVKNKIHQKAQRRINDVNIKPIQKSYAKSNSLNVMSSQPKKLINLKTNELNNEDANRPASDSDDNLIEFIELKDTMHLKLESESDVNGKIGNDDDQEIVDDDDDKDYRCNICLEQNKNLLQLKNHMFAVHNIAYVCRDCHGSYELRTDYEIHIQRSDCVKNLNVMRKYITLIGPPITSRVNAENVYSCESCRRMFSDITSYCTHAQQHAKTFMCKICSVESFRNRTEMYAHLKLGNHYIEQIPRWRQVFDRHSLYASSVGVKRAGPTPKRRRIK